MAISRYILFSRWVVWFPTVRTSKIIVWKLIKIDTYCQQRKSSAETLVSGYIRFVRIFAWVL